jgi:cyclopropane fatty-acyl-phospholipid synthase-like methyltransferase
MPGFPNVSVQSGFVGRAGELALDEGFRFYRVVNSYCEAAGRPIDNDITVLDFGCGWGRMSRLFFRSISSPNFWGADVDPRIIRFCNNNMHHGTYKVIPPNPPTKFSSDSFDLIFAYSVFSHLAEPTALAWVKELARLLKPGGLLIATTQGLDFLDFCEDKQGKVHEKAWYNMLAQSFLPIEKSKEAYKNGQFLFESQARKDTDIRESSYYGDALIPKQYIQQNYTPYLDLVDFVKEGSFYEKAQTRLGQALFVMQKPTQSADPLVNTKVPNYPGTLHDFAKAHELSFKNHFDLLLRSVDEPVVDGVQMPGFPDSATQSKFVGSVGQPALREGFSFYLVLREYCKQTGNSVYRDIPVLDFGCGWGRMSRLFFHSISSQNFWGVDVDPEMVQFCEANMHHGNYRVIQPDPPTSFDANSFNVIFAYSVFSHLAEPVALAWIKEFARILKPGGVLIVTTQGRNFLDFCESKQGVAQENEWFQGLAQSFLPIEKSKADYDAGKFLFDSHINEADAALKRSHYGDALIPPEYIQKNYTPYLDLIDFVQDHTRFETARTQLAQALFVMQKPKTENEG